MKILLISHRNSYAGIENDEVDGLDDSSKENFDADCVKEDIAWLQLQRSYVKVKKLLSDITMSISLAIPNKPYLPKLLNVHQDGQEYSR